MVEDDQRLKLKSYQNSRQLGAYCSCEFRIQYKWTSSERSALWEREAQVNSLNWKYETVIVVLQLHSVSDFASRHSTRRRDAGKRRSF